LAFKTSNFPEAITTVNNATPKADVVLIPNLTVRVVTSALENGRLDLDAALIISTVVKGSGKILLKHSDVIRDQ